MVRVTNYECRTTQAGKEFFVLLLQGDVELVQSAETGKFYATARKASLPCTFDENTCKMLMGKELSGTIEKVECDPYDFTNPATGEVVELFHRYEYVEEQATKAPAVKTKPKVAKQASN